MTTAEPPESKRSDNAHAADPRAAVPPAEAPVLKPYEPPAGWPKVEVPQYVPPTEDERSAEYLAPTGGRMRTQQAGVTQARQPTVAEARARAKALAERKQRELEANQAEARKRQLKRRLIGGVAVVGVVGVVALSINALSSYDSVTASCVNADGVVVSDTYCGGTPGVGGFFFVAGSQYRYNYGGTGAIGQRISGGSTIKPQGAEIKTKSGSTIQRGGLGAKLGGIGSGS